MARGRWCGPLGIKQRYEGFSTCYLARRRRMRARREAFRPAGAGDGTGSAVGSRWHVADKRAAYHGAASFCLLSDERGFVVF